MNNKEQELKCIIIEQKSIRVLDQTLLPNTIKYIDILNIEDAWQSIKEMKVRGAPLIAVVALQGLKIELLNNNQILNDHNIILDYLVKNAEYLKTSRPTAVNLANDLDNLIKNVNTIINDTNGNSPDE